MSNSPHFYKFPTARKRTLRWLYPDKYFEPAYFIDRNGDKILLIDIMASCGFGEMGEDKSSPDQQSA